MIYFMIYSFKYVSRLSVKVSAAVEASERAW